MGDGTNIAAIITRGVAGIIVLVLLEGIACVTAHVADGIAIAGIGVGDGANIAAIITRGVAGVIVLVLLEGITGVFTHVTNLIAIAGVGVLDYTLIFTHITRSIASVRVDVVIHIGAVAALAFVPVQIFVTRPRIAVFVGDDRQQSILVFDGLLSLAVGEIAVADTAEPVLNVTALKVIGVDRLVVGEGVGSVFAMLRAADLADRKRNTGGGAALVVGKGKFFVRAFNDLAAVVTGSIGDVSMLNTG